MVLRCVYGTCNSDTRYPERLNGVKILPFPKPKTQYNRCLRWIEACGRPEAKLNVYKIDRNKGVCTKHFFDASGPTKLHPDPLPWRDSQHSGEKPPPRKKRKKSQDNLNFKPDPEVIIRSSHPCLSNASTQTEEMWTPAWDMFTLSAESQRMKEELHLKDVEINCFREELQRKKEELQKLTETVHEQEKKIKHYETQFSMRIVEKKDK